MAVKSLIGNRYQLHEALGEGGMGTVYRATDLLTGQSVALKRVTTSVHQQAVDTFPFGVNNTALRVALAHEFQILASMRHPNVINVIDYGFDNLKQPYFTMRLVKNPQTILNAARGKSLWRKVDLLIKLLQALTYLHRRGVLHRDLKPANVLVEGIDRVQVLDFGLSVMREGAPPDHAVGTLTHVAPEVLNGDPPTEASDLYSVGVMAYELFAGRHPFDIDVIDKLVHDIMLADPDLTRLNVNPELTRVVAKLLDKNPKGRYTNAQEVIAAFCGGIGQSVPQEGFAIRESFLQAARFVGRDVELGQLSEALIEALNLRGSAWVVNGENGVGKSRLIDELATLAKVNGVLVLRGEGVAEGGLIYQLWRDPIRRLVLSTELTDLEAGILAEIVPDIAQLLERHVPDAPELVGAPRLTRLILTIEGLLRRQTEPVLLILEDLQWALESLEPLKHLVTICADLPLLIVGSYRNDEKPELAQTLSAMRALQLGRLSDEAIAELSASMLGKSGEKPEIVGLLQRETEGNVFFLVEVIRTLAAEVGHLSDIVRLTLPQAVIAGGVQQVAQRRLSQLPDDAKPLLRLAACAGRQLDLAILRNLYSGDLETWLTTCAGAAVIEEIDGTWRFTHNRLREAAQPTEESERAAFNREIAETIEAVYPDDTSRAPQLLEYWHIAGDRAKEAHYAYLAGTHLITLSVYGEAIRFLERGLRLTEEESPQRISIQIQLGNVREKMGDYETSAVWLHSALESARKSGDKAGIAAALNILGRTGLNQGNYNDARAYFTESLMIRRSIEDTSGSAESLRNYGLVAHRQSDYDLARVLFEESYSICEQLNDSWGRARSLACLGIVASDIGEHEQARNYYEQSLTIQRQIGDRAGIAITLNNLGVIADEVGDYHTAHTHYEQALAIQREIGNRQNIALALNNLGLIAFNQRDYIAARAHCAESLTICESLHDSYGIAYSHDTLSRLDRKAGKYAQAQRHATEAFEMRRDMGDRRDMAESLESLGMIAFRQGDPGLALACLGEALAICREIGHPIFAAASLCRAAFVHFALKNLDTARGELQEALNIAFNARAIPVVLETMVGFAQLALVEDRLDLSNSLVTVVNAHPLGTVSDVKEWLDPLMVDLKKLAPQPTETAQSEDAAKTLKTLDQAVHELLKDSAANLE